MTQREFQRAFDVAASDADLSAEAEQGHVFIGFGLPGFRQVTVTVRQVAELIRWQCQQFNGQWDAVELDGVRRAGRHKFIIVGD